MRASLVIGLICVSAATVAAKPVALALVVNGQEIWMGNDDIETDEATRYVGVLNGLEHAIDQVDLKSILPAGSVISVVSYSTGADYLVRDAPIATFTGAALGTQRDYRNKIGTDMVQGIELAIADLKASRAPRKALIVLGDGNDTNNEAAAPMLAQMKREAEAAGIETFAIVYKTALSADGDVIRRMVPNVKSTASTQGVGDWLGTVAFVFADQPEAAPVAVPAPASSPWWDSRWLAELMLGAALAGLYAAFLRLRVNA